MQLLGNTVTNETVIRRELLLDEGDPYSQVKVDKSVSHLLRSRRLFASVKEEISDEALPNTKNIEINVEEMPTGEISAGAGIGTNGGSFAFNIKENNWLGKVSQVSANADVSQDTVRGSLNFVKNYNFTGKDLRYNFENIKNDKPDSGYENSVLGAGIGVSYEKFKDIYFAPGLGLTVDDLTTNETASELLKTIRKHK